MTKIYLVSPEKIILDDFAKKLEEALSTKKISVFQLRLKNISEEEILNSCQKLLPICHKFGVPFILNDDFELALKVGASGVHIGKGDGNIKEIRQIVPENFIIGASCYDSRHLAMDAAESGVDYIAFGAFFPSITKKSCGRPKAEILEWADMLLEVPTVAIGGINHQNCQELIEAKADFIAVISYIWQNSAGVREAINNLAQICHATKNAEFVS